METYQITSATLGLLIAGLIIWLVRRDHLHGKYALWWVFVALGFAGLGIAPRLVDAIAVNLGISYPPILVVLLGMSVITLKLVTMDIERSKGQIKMNRLAQRMAMLESEMAELKTKSDDLPVEKDRMK